MKVLYFCNINRDSNAAVGVLKKISSQVKVLKEAGHDVHLAFYQNSTQYTIINNSSQILFTIDLKGLHGNKRTKVIIKSLLRFIISEKYKCIYSRFESYSLLLAQFYKKLSKLGCIVLLEIPTYPISQRWISIKTSFEQRKIKTALHQLYNATINSMGILRFKNGVTKIVNNNCYSRIWGIETLQIHNGVDIDSVTKHNSRICCEREIALIGVANIAKWHGYDRVIDGLIEYYSSDVEIDVIFHIVGEGLELIRLKKMAQEPRINGKVIFHGLVTGENLDKLFDMADIGVSVLGGHRSHMKTCDSLKSKEYCARNIPFITGKIEKFYTDMDFVLSIPDDDTPLNINEVIRFAEKIKNDPNIKQNMEKFANEHCGWEQAFKAVLEFLREME